MIGQGSHRRTSPSVPTRRPSLVARFLACEQGATAIEYGLICSLMFLAIVASVQHVATGTTSLHANISNALQ